MLIDESIKTIFLHNPKCGGKFIRKNFWAQNPDCPPFVPNVRDGYTTETNVVVAHIDLKTLPRFVPDYEEYKIVTFIRNPYNRFISALNWCYKFQPKIQKLMSDHYMDYEAICQYLVYLNNYEQDLFLRNTAIPWLMPQSYFVGPNVITLRYESLTDWRFLLNLFNIHDAQVCIQNDYILSDTCKELIERLYFDDSKIFDLYAGRIDRL